MVDFFYIMIRVNSYYLIEYMTNMKIQESFEYIRRNHNLVYVSLFSLLLIASFVFSSITIESQYANAQASPALKTFEIKMKIEKKIVELGDNNKVTVTVRDVQSGNPLSGVTVKATTLFAGAKVLKQTGKITDDNGKVYITIPTSKDSLPGVNVVETTVLFAGYQDAIVANTFATTDEDIPDFEDCYDNNDNDDDC